VVIDIGRTTKKMMIDEVIVTLVLKKMMQKDFESTKEALVVHGRLKEKGNKKEKGRSKSFETSNSSGNSKEICWNYGNIRHFKRDCKEEKDENNKKKNYSNDEFEKYSQEDGGDDFVAALVECACQSEWLIDSRAYVHVTSHREWFLVYKEYDGGKVYLGVDSHVSIVGHGRILIAFPNDRVKGINGGLHILGLAQNLL
jgi:hypothetical protein